MDEKCKLLLSQLDHELERKCGELRLKRRERAFRRLFLCVCALFVIMPFLLIFAGINVVTIFGPVVTFLGTALVVLLPVILGNDPGGLPL